MLPVIFDEEKSTFLFEINTEVFSELMNALLAYDYFLDIHDIHNIGGFTEKELKSLYEKHFCDGDKTSLSLNIHEIEILYSMLDLSDIRKQVTSLPYNAETLSEFINALSIFWSVVRYE